MKNAVAQGPHHCAAAMVPSLDASQWTCVRCKITQKRRDGDVTFVGRKKRAPRKPRAPRARRTKANFAARDALREEIATLAPRR